MTRSRRNRSNNRNVKFHRNWRKLPNQREKRLQRELTNNREELDFEPLDEDRNEFSVQIPLEDQLKSWTVNNGISMRGLDSLLAILRSAGHKELPKSYRTLLQTPRNINLSSYGDAKYWHRGLGECLKIVFLKLDKSMNVQLKFNIDGLPIFKSSQIQCWPILVSVHGEVHYNEKHVLIIFLEYMP